MNIWKHICRYSVKWIHGSLQKSRSFSLKWKDKYQFIRIQWLYIVLLISKYLRDSGQVVHQSTGDDDTMIVWSALQYVANWRNWSECCCWWHRCSCATYLPLETEHGGYIFSFRGWKKFEDFDLVGQVAPVITSHHYLHALSGCDTTSTR